MRNLVILHLNPNRNQYFNGLHREQKNHNTTYNMGGSKYDLYFQGVTQINALKVLYNSLFLEKLDFQKKQVFLNFNINLVRNKRFF